MGNALLDFVMGLARDPAAAARYSADPAGALAEAGLPGVLPADVDNLLPMVTDSLAMSTPDWGLCAPAHGPDPNVWSSGAAAVAFESFGPGRTAVGIAPAIPPAVIIEPQVDDSPPDDLPAEVPHIDENPAQWDPVLPFDHHTDPPSVDHPVDPLIP